MSSSAPSTTPIGDVNGGPITETIISRVQTTFTPSRFAIYNNSKSHAHHAERRGSQNVTESHFLLEIVSEAFKGKAQPARHREVYALFKEEMSMPNGVHSLQLKTKTPEEWAKLEAAGKSSGLSTIWLMATLGNRPAAASAKISKADIQSTKIPGVCRMITDPDGPLALRLSSNLLYGVSLVYQQQIAYLLADVSQIQTKLSQDNILPLITLDPKAAKTKRSSLVLRNHPLAFNIEFSLLPQGPIPSTNDDDNDTTLNSSMMARQHTNSNANIIYEDDYYGVPHHALNDKDDDDISFGAEFGFEFNDSGEIQFYDQPQRRTQTASSQGTVHNAERRIDAEDEDEVVDGSAVLSRMAASAATNRDSAALPRVEEEVDYNYDDYNNDQPVYHLPALPDGMPEDDGLPHLLPLLHQSTGRDLSIGLDDAIVFGSDPSTPQAGAGGQARRNANARRAAVFDTQNVLDAETLKRFRDNYEIHMATARASKRQRREMRLRAQPMSLRTYLQQAIQFPFGNLLRTLDPSFLLQDAESPEPADLEIGRGGAQRLQSTPRQTSMDIETGRAGQTPSMSGLGVSPQSVPISESSGQHSRRGDLSSPLPRGRSRPPSIGYDLDDIPEIAEGADFLRAISAARQGSQANRPQDNLDSNLQDDHGYDGGLDYGESYSYDQYNIQDGDLRLQDDDFDLDGSLRELLEAESEDDEEQERSQKKSIFSDENLFLKYIGRKIERNNDKILPPSLLQGAAGVTGAAHKASRNIGSSYSVRSRSGPLSRPGSSSTSGSRSRSPSPHLRGFTPVKTRSGAGATAAAGTNAATSRFGGHDFISFDTLVPIATTSRQKAAEAFLLVLKMATNKQIRLKQDVQNRTNVGDEEEAAGGPSTGILIFL